MKNQWVRKTDNEIEEVKKKNFKSSFSLVMPLGLSFFAFFILPYFTAIKPEHPERVQLLGTLALFLTIYAYQIYTGKSLVRPGNQKICNTCYKEDYLSNKNCSCGGIFEPEDYFINQNASKEIPPDVKDGESSRKFKKQILIKLFKVIFVALVIIFVLLSIITGILILTKGYHEAIAIMTQLLTSPFLLLGLYLLWIPLSAFFKHERHSF